MMTQNITNTQTCIQKHEQREHRETTWLPRSLCTTGWSIQNQSQGHLDSICYHEREKIKLKMMKPVTWKVHEDYFLIT